MTTPFVDLTRLSEDVRREAEEDYVGIWQIARTLMEAGLEDDLLVEMIVEVVGRVSELGVEIGEFRSREFEFWSGDRAIKLERLRHELRMLNRAPDIGEVAWLAIR